MTTPWLSHDEPSLNSIPNGPSKLPLESGLVTRRERHCGDACIIPPEPSQSFHRTNLFLIAGAAYRGPLVAAWRLQSSW